MLKWAVGVGYITTNPAADIPKPAKERSRERVLTIDEVRAILSACDSLAGVQADFVKFLLFSGQRLNEIAKLTTLTKPLLLLPEYPQHQGIQGC